MNAGQGGGDTRVSAAERRHGGRARWVRRGRRAGALALLVVDHVPS